jgi:hypothetical protein
MQVADDPSLSRPLALNLDMSVLHAHVQIHSFAFSVKGDKYFVKQ